MADKGKKQSKKRLSKQKPGEKRKKLIADLTLQGKFWGSRGALRLEEEFLMICKISGLAFMTERFRISSFAPEIPGEFFSAISSTYYAASGNALSHIWQVNLFSKSLWLWRAWRCMRKAEKYSDEFAKLKPMKDMTLGELDVRACVLNKAGRRNEAVNLLSHGIMRILIKKTGTKHDLCLFLIHEAEIYEKMKKIGEAENNYAKAIQLLRDNALPHLTKVRVLKSYGVFLAERKMLDKAESALNDALDLARDSKLYDQEVKIKAVFKDFKLAIR